MTKDEMVAIDERIKASVLAQIAAGQPATMCCSPVADGSYFDDDLYTECSRCKTLVRYRPYVPDHWEKVCIDCIGAALAEAEDE